MKRTSRSIALAALLAGIGGVATPGATAGAPVARVPAGVPDSGGVVVQEPEEALAHDLAVSAKSMGWTVEQAAAHHAAGEAVGAVAEAVAKAHRDVFVGSRLSDAPGGTPTLYVKGPASAAVKALVAKAPVPIHLADNQPYSFDELEARKSGVTEALATLGLRGFATGFRLGGRGVVTATVERTPGLPGDPAGVLALLPEAMRSYVAVTVRDGHVVTPHADAMGGMWLNDDGVNHCTSGWSVYRTWTGTTGVATAAHCSSGGDTPDEISDGFDYYWTWTFVERHIGVTNATAGTWGDVEWGTTGDIEPAAFYTSRTSTRRVTAVEPYSGISENELVCGYGRRSNLASCSTVMDLSHDCYVPNSGGEIATRQVRVFGDNFEPTDSGGPKYYANKAFGSHFGQCDGGDAFSVADYYDEALSVRVRLSQTLATRVSLYAGDKLVSSDGDFTAIMQSDGNFVLYQNGVGALWSTGTNGNTNARIVMQADGNLVVRRTDGTAVWDSNTAGSGMQLVMQTDGNLVMYGGGVAHWSSGTCCH